MTVRAEAHTPHANTVGVFQTKKRARGPRPEGPSRTSQSLTFHPSLPRRGIDRWVKLDAGGVVLVSAAILQFLAGLGMPESDKAIFVAVARYCPSGLNATL